MATWILVRHAESVANADGWLAGHHDVDLSLEGRRQASALADDPRLTLFDRAICSDLRRAVLTAVGPCERLGVTPVWDRRLRERDIGDWTGLPRTALPVPRADLARWEAAPPAGETLATVAHRALDALSAADGDDRVLVVSHGGPLRILLGLWTSWREGTPVPEPSALRPVRNADPIVLLAPRGMWESVRPLVPTR